MKELITIGHATAGAVITATARAVITAANTLIGRVTKPISPNASIWDECHPCASEPDEPKTDGAPGTPDEINAKFDELKHKALCRIDYQIQDLQLAFARDLDDIRRRGAVKTAKLEALRQSALTAATEEEKC